MFGEHDPAGMALNWTDGKRSQAQERPKFVLSEQPVPAVSFKEVFIIVIVIIISFWKITFGCTQLT